MANTIEVEEYRSPVWNYLLLFALLITVIFFFAYLFISDPFWTSIFRFIAFAGFAGAVLVIMQVWEKPKKMRAEISSKNLAVYYLRKETEVKEELFDRKTIKKIHRKDVTPAWDFLSNTSIYKHIISFTDTDNQLSLFKYSGRDIYLNKDDSSAFEAFLSENDISLSH